MEYRPMISVIMPTYNAQAYIQTAIESVMRQTLKDWELWVIDDGSTDDTVACAEALAAQDERIRVLVNKHNMGAAATRNRGISHCRGDFIAFLDSDDIWLPDKLHKQIMHLQKTGGDLCYTSYAIIGADGDSVRPDYIVPETVDFSSMLRENVIGCSTVMIRRDTAMQYRFTTEFYHEDYVYWLELLKTGHRAVGCQEVLTQWRLLETSRSFHKGRSAKNRWRIYRNYLKLPLWQAMGAFGGYMFAGAKKYRKRG